MLRNTKTQLLSLAIIGVLAGAVVAESAQAQDSQTRSQRNKKKGEVEVRYPDATRTAPKANPAAKLQGKEKKLFDLFNNSEFEQAKPLADEIIADPKATDYDKAIASFIASQAAYNLNENEAAKTYAQQAVALNQLENDNHFGAMLFLAQLQADGAEKPEDYAPALATLDAFFAESKSQKPEDLIVRGNLLYQAGKAKDAIPYLKQAIDATPEPKDQWVQLLMASYADAGQNAEAVALAEKLAAKSPDDKKAQLNLASVYQQADQMDKAVATLEKLRAAGKFSEERDYKSLYTAYANMDGKEKQVVAVVNEGLQKGLLKPDYNSYVALAQSYYYSEQIPQAIDAWKKAAPLAPTGETWLNLARVLQGEGRIAEAKDAARQAKAKGGLKKPADADKIINLK